MLIKNVCQDINQCVIHIPDELLAAHCNLETLPYFKMFMIYN